MATLPCAKNVAKWAKERGIDQELSVGGDGASAEFKFEKFINTQMTKKDPGFYTTLATLDIPFEFNFGADAFQMFLNRSFTQLCVRFPQAVELVSSHSASHTFGLYEGKDDYDNLQKFFGKVAAFMHRRLFPGMGCIPHQGAKETGLSAEQVRCNGAVGLGSKVEADSGSQGVFFSAEVTKVRGDGDGAKYDVVFDGYMVNRPVDFELEYKNGPHEGTKVTVKTLFTLSGDLPFQRAFFGKKTRFCDKKFLCNKCIKCDKADLKKVNHHEEQQEHLRPSLPCCTYEGTPQRLALQLPLLRFCCVHRRRH
jgi:hypothetical protein